MTDPTSDPKSALLDAALTHVPFDGWTEASFRAAIDDTGLAPDLARSLCPRGALDLAIAYHQRGDQAMVDRLAETDLTTLRFRDRVAAAVRYRLEAVGDKELVRRGVTLFSLPQNSAEGARMIWGTADRIWTALGDTSQDINWYSKRATLSGVYSSTVLYWLGDDSPDHERTWEFLDRRIDNVMQFEKLKSQVRGNPLLKPFVAGADRVLSGIRAPGARRDDLPGHFADPQQE